jgi:hypothetical protein
MKVFLALLEWSDRVSTTYSSHFSMATEQHECQSWLISIRSTQHDGFVGPALIEGLRNM